MPKGFGLKVMSFSCVGRILISLLFILPLFSPSIFTTQ